MPSDTVHSSGSDGNNDMATDILFVSIQHTAVVLMVKMTWQQIFCLSKTTHSNGSDGNRYFVYLEQYTAKVLMVTDILFI